jgi:hypothetical protein
MSEVLYNVTVNVSDEVLSEWLQWMESTHIPEVLATGFFIQRNLCECARLSRAARRTPFSTRRPLWRATSDT